MQFYRKKGRTMGVPIVPMIDILTILLIFFIVHTQWKKPQTLLKIDVPGAEFIEGAPSTEQRAVLAVTEESSISLNGYLVEIDELPAALERLKKENPYLETCKIISNSDAHYLEDIHEPELTIQVSEKSIQGVLEALGTR